MKRQDLSEAEREVIDSYLAEMASLNATLGKDSTAFEIHEVKIKVSKLENHIEHIKPNFLYKEDTL